MVLKLKQDLSQTDIEISIIYPEKNRKIKRIVSFINSIDSEIECNFNNSTKLLNVSNIYYIESYDNNTIIFCQNENYNIKDRLYQVYNKLTDKGFAQISKYCIVNVNKLEKFTFMPNSCMEATLSNGKNLKITRKYITDIKRIMREEL